MRLITEHQDRGCLPLDTLQPDGRTVKQHLQDKHPPGRPAIPSAISDSPPAAEPHEVIFDQIDGPLIRTIVQGMDGSADPQGSMRAIGRECAPPSGEPQKICASPLPD